MLYDIILIIIVLLSVFMGIRNGASKTLLSLLAIVGAAVLAVLLSKPLAEFIFESFMRSSLEREVGLAIADALKNPEGYQGNFDNPLAAAFVGAMAYLGNPQENVTASCEELIAEKGSDAAPAIVDLFKPVVTGVVSVIAAIILFILLAIILVFISRIIAKAFRLPLIKIADTVAGGVLGFVRGMITVVAIALLLRLLAPVIGQNVPMMSADSINNSAIFSMIYNSSVSHGIQSFIYSIG